jgi:cytochrome P450 family 13
MKATTIGTGDNAIHIPVGMIVQSDTWNLHRDPNIWGDDADMFVPER